MVWIFEKLLSFHKVLVSLMEITGLNASGADMECWECAFVTTHSKKKQMHISDHLVFADTQSPNKKNQKSLNNPHTEKRKGKFGY